MLTASGSTEAGRKSIRETVKQRVQRLALRGAKRPIAEPQRRGVTAGLLQETPQFAVLRLPFYRLKGLAMVATGQAMAGGATLCADVFMEEGLPADFIPQFWRAAEALSASSPDGATEARHAGDSTSRRWSARCTGSHHSALAVPDVVAFQSGLDLRREH